MRAKSPTTKPAARADVKRDTMYAPPRPNLVALGFMSLWIVILSLPMWAGQYMAGPSSDQYSTGWAIRHWGAEQWRRTGHIPLWDPERLSGVVVAAGFGDLFYPSAWLRLFMPTTIAIDLAFVVHYVLAGFFLYLLLRMLDTSWLGSVVGGTAYQLSGVVVSYASPGHDGKLFVTALFPLMLIGLMLGIRQRRFEGYALLGLSVGLALLSPQYQTTQYALLAAGIFALYLTFGEPNSLTNAERWSGIGYATLGVVLGFGLSMIQVLPFIHYIPFSPRAGVQGYEWSTTYATPWIHVPEFFISGFTGQSPLGTYWGPNHLKHHSEYLGLPVIALAILGVGGSRKRLVRWILGIALLFFLIALGDGTPFYRMWWAVVPYVDKTRAPGIAFYIVGFAASVLAAFGVERLQRGEGSRWARASAVAGSVVVVLAFLQVFGVIAGAYTQGTAQAAIAERAQSGIMWGAVGSGIGLAITGAVVLIFRRGVIAVRGFSLVLTLVVGADLWRAGSGFWHWSRPESEQIASDDITRRLKQTPLPYRVYDLHHVYAADALMAHDIPQVTGYHGNHLQTYLDLIGGEDEQVNLLRSLNLWRLLAVRYLIVGTDSIRVPGFHKILGPTRTGLGRTAYLFEADTTPTYARVIPAGVTVDTSQIVPTLVDPRFDYSRIVLLSTDQALKAPPAVLPTPSASRATVTAWEPGNMTVALDPAPTEPSYLLVSENWYTDWRARVDSDTAQVLRGNQSLITVPLRAGARQVKLTFTSNDFATGKRITWASLIGLFVMAAAPSVLRRRRAAA
jgi:hypothetical protein